MSLSLDHVVIHVTDLEAAIADFSAIGFNVQRGGQHAEGATHNALVGFADGLMRQSAACRVSSTLRCCPARWAR